MIEPHHTSGLGPTDLVRGDVKLASPPEVYARLSELLDKADVSAGDLAAVIEKDPGLTARLLKVVNSVFYGYPAQISTVSRAVTIIGTRELHDLVLATVVMDLFNGLPNELISMHRFWKRSLCCAVLARALAANREQRESLESIFVAGLLRDVGHLIIYRRLPELAREALLRHQHQNMPLHLAERQVLGFDYAAVGAELMKVWRLPLLLRESVQHQHGPEEAPNYATEAAVVAIAALLAEAGTFSLEHISREHLPDAPLWKRAGLSPDVLQGTLSVASERFEMALADFLSV